MAEKYYPDYAGRVPLLLKVNGKTDIPPSDEAFSTTNASVEDAVRLGADAVGYTLYVGSPRQDQDLLQLKRVREDCDRYGMPLVIWAYPRGLGGRRRRAARTPSTRSTTPRGWRWRWAPTSSSSTCRSPEPHKDSPAPYDTIEVTQEEAVRQVVESAGRSLVVLSGGSKIDDDALLRQTRMIMECGGSGVIYGRNVWQREWSEANDVVDQIKEILVSSVIADALGPPRSAPASAPTRHIRARQDRRAR